MNAEHDSSLTLMAPSANRLQWLCLHKCLLVIINQSIPNGEVSFPSMVMIIIVLNDQAGLIMHLPLCNGVQQGCPLAQWLTMDDWWICQTYIEPFRYYIMMHWYLFSSSLLCDSHHWAIVKCCSLHTMEITSLMDDIIVLTLSIIILLANLTCLLCVNMVNPATSAAHPNKSVDK